MMKCAICNDECEEEELDDGICSNCLASIIHNEMMYPSRDDFT